MNLEFIKPQNLGSLLMKSSQSNFNLRSLSSQLSNYYCTKDEIRYDNRSHFNQNMYYVYCIYLIDYPKFPACMVTQQSEMPSTLVKVIMSVLDLHIMDLFWIQNFITTSTFLGKNQISHQNKSLVLFSEKGRFYASLNLCLVLLHINIVSHRQ